MDDLQAVNPLELADRRRSPGLIFDYLRDLILQGEIKPQTVISQVELAERLGVSRTPLREALGRLQQEGLVEAEPNRRARVVGFDPNDLEIVYASRLFYEPLALMATVPHLLTEDMGMIEAALVEMRRASHENDYAAWELAHSDFHGLLALYAPEVLKRQIAKFSARGDGYRRVYQSSISRNWNTGDSQHAAILEACKAREPVLAAEELARHLASVAIALLGTIVPEHEPTVVRGALNLVGSRVWSTQNGVPPVRRRSSA